MLSNHYTISRGCNPFIARVAFGWLGERPEIRSPLVVGAQHILGLIPWLEVLLFIETPAEKRPFCRPVERTFGGAG